MKKTFFNIFVLILCVILSLPLFSSCDQEEKSSEASEEVIPHKTYEKGVFSFDYPESYENSKEPNTTILKYVNPPKKAIIISSQEKTKEYRDMTEISFQSLIKNPFQKANLKVENYSHRIEKNKNGVETTILSYDVTYRETKKKQTIFAVDTLYKTYVIIVISPDEDPEAVSFIFDSFKLKEEKLEYSTCDEFPLAFEYPKTYSYTSQNGIHIMRESYTGNNITVIKEEKTDIYSEMTEENFNILIKPQLEAQGMDVSNYSFSKEVNPFGIEVAILSYDAKLNNLSITQKLFCVNLKDFSTSEESTFVITLTQTEKDEDTINHVFETIEQETIKIIK